MAKAHFVKKARKDNKDHLIKAGDSYYWWAFMSGGRGGPKHYSKTKPRASQLTQSEFWSAVYEMQEREEPELDAIESERDSMVDELRSLGDDMQGRFDNMPEGLQQGESGQMLEERVSALEDAAGELENVDCRADDNEGNPIDPASDEGKQKASEMWQEIQDALGNISCS